MISVSKHYELDSATIFKKIISNEITQYERDTFLVVNFPQIFFIPRYVKSTIRVYNCLTDAKKNYSHFYAFPKSSAVFYHQQTFYFVGVENFMTCLSTVPDMKFSKTGINKLLQRSDAIWILRTNENSKASPKPSAKIIGFGGFDKNDNHLSSVISVDLSGVVTEVQISQDSLTVSLLSRLSMAAVYDPIQDLVYFHGGYNSMSTGNKMPSKQFHSDLFQFSFTTNTATLLPSLESKSAPCARYRHTMILVNNTRLFTMGGVTFNSKNDTIGLYEFNLQSKSWYKYHVDVLGNVASLFNFRPGMIMASTVTRLYSFDVPPKYIPMIRRVSQFCDCVIVGKEW